MLRDWWDSSAGLFGCFGFFYRYAVRGDVYYVANHGVCDSRLGCRRKRVGLAKMSRLQNVDVALLPESDFSRTL